MSKEPEGLVEVMIAGVVLIILGSALAPLLPFDVAALGWLLLIFGALAGALMMVFAIAQLVESLS